MLRFKHKDRDLQENNKRYSVKRFLCKCLVLCVSRRITCDLSAACNVTLPLRGCLRCHLVKERGRGIPPIGNKIKISRANMSEMGPPHITSGITQPHPHVYTSVIDIIPTTAHQRRTTNNIITLYTTKRR